MHLLSGYEGKRSTISTVDDCETELGEISHGVNRTEHSGRRAMRVGQGYLLFVGISLSRTMEPSVELSTLSGEEGLQ